MALLEAIREARFGHGGYGRRGVFCFRAAPGRRASYARTLATRSTPKVPCGRWGKFAVKARGILPSTANIVRDAHGRDDTAGGRVLLVEDDAEIADVLRRSLRNEGYEVRTSADGIEALEAAAGFVPDLVVLDLGLPRLDGIEVCRRLRADSDVPILMLTARTEPRTASTASTAAPTTTS